MLTFRKIFKRLVTLSLILLLCHIHTHALTWVQAYMCTNTHMHIWYIHFLYIYFSISFLLACKIISMFIFTYLYSHPTYYVICLNKWNSVQYLKNHIPVIFLSQITLILPQVFSQCHTVTATCLTEQEQMLNCKPHHRNLTEEKLNNKYKFAQNSLCFEILNTCDLSSLAESFTCKHRIEYWTIYKMQGLEWRSVPWPLMHHVKCNWILDYNFIKYQVLIPVWTSDILKKLALLLLQHFTLEYLILMHCYYLYTFTKF
jgi:hypothetical protein